jgi:hypothetical protein
MDRAFPEEIALKTMQFLQKMYEDLTSKELQEETPKEDSEFKEATLALEELKASLDEE